MTYNPAPVPIESDRWRSWMANELSRIANELNLQQELVAYGGVWREQQAQPLTVNLTTDWEPILGYTTQRPTPARRFEVDIAQGRIRLLVPGVYSVSMLIVYDGQINRYVDFGLQIDDIEPGLPTVRQEMLTSKGDMVVSYTTLVNAVDAPKDYYLVWRGEINMTVDFELGGWSLLRVDYPGIDSP